MRTFQVLTDSTSDVVKELRDKYDLDYVKMTFRQKDKEYFADLDWTELSATEYYQAMRAGNRAVTNLVPTSELEAKYTEYLEKGLDILYIACSNKLSGSLNNGKIVAEEFKEKYPDRKIICVDSLRSNMAEGAIAIEAAKMASEGKTIEETAKWVEENRLYFRTLATVATLDWLKKAGRIKASAAFFGNLMGVKPIIIGDVKGNNYAFKKVKGRSTSLDELVSLTKEQVNENTKVIYVEHADSIEAAYYVTNKIKEATGIQNILITNLGPIIGATTGPDTITINFQGTKVTIAGEE